MSLREALLARIHEHLARTGMTPGQFSHEVARDYGWVRRLERGQVSLRSIERAEAFLEGRPLPPFGPRSAASEQVAA